MKCIHCDNHLPSKRGFSKITKNGSIILGKMACCLPGCISFGVNYRSAKFQEIVMGKTRDEVQKRIKERTSKTQKTNLLRGNFKGDKNSQSKKRLMDKGMQPDEIDEYFSKKSKQSAKTKTDAGFYANKGNNPFSLEFWVQRGLTEFEAQKIINGRIRNTQDFWIKRGYSKDEAELLSKNSADTNSLAAKVKKWGQTGEEKYKQTREKLKNSWNPLCAQGKKFSSSTQANKFFLSLYRLCRRLGYVRNDFMFKLNRGEMFIRDGKNIYFYDFVIRPLKLIIEFNGEHVHPPKDLLQTQEWHNWRHAFSKQTADEVAAYEDKKYSAAHRQGYTIITVWSKDLTALQKTKLQIKEHHANQSNIT